MKGVDEKNTLDLKHLLATARSAERAHRRMLPPGRLLHPPDCERYRPAAVLVPLYREAGTLGLVMMVRSFAASRHKGEVAFPGGLREPGDRSPTETALREMEEELGIPASSVQVLGQLSEVCIPPTRLRVSPVVGWIEALPAFRPNPEEVERILRVPLAALLAGKPHFWKPPTWERPVACFAVEEFCIWGASAMILSELLDLLAEPARRHLAKDSDEEGTHG